MICFIDARCCIKYRIYALYNNLNKHAQYINYQSHPPPKYAWWLSHPPLSIESPASRRKNASAPWGGPGSGWLAIIVWQVN